MLIVLNAMGYRKTGFEDFGTLGIFSDKQTMMSFLKEHLRKNNFEVSPTDRESNMPNMPIFANENYHQYFVFAQCFNEMDSDAQDVDSATTLLDVDDLLKNF